MKRVLVVLASAWLVACGSPSTPSNQPPTTGSIAITPSSAGIQAATTLMFTGNGVTDPNGDTITYKWDFGDGNTGSGQVATHSYSTAGTFTVKLAVNDGHNPDVAAAQVNVPIRSLSATWQGTVTCTTCNPTSRTVTLQLTQVGANVSGTCADSHNGGAFASITIQTATLDSTTGLFTFNGSCSAGFEQFGMKYDPVADQFTVSNWDSPRTRARSRVTRSVAEGQRGAEPACPARFRMIAVGIDDEVNVRGLGACGPDEVGEVARVADGLHALFRPGVDPAARHRREGRTPQLPQQRPAIPPDRRGHHDQPAEPPRRVGRDRDGGEAAQRGAAEPHPIAIGADGIRLREKRHDLVDQKVRVAVGQTGAGLFAGRRRVLRDARDLTMVDTDDHERRNGAGGDERVDGLGDVPGLMMERPLGIEEVLPVVQQQEGVGTLGHAVAGRQIDGQVPVGAEPLRMEPLMAFQLGSRRGHARSV